MSNNGSYTTMRIGAKDIATFRGIINLFAEVFEEPLQREAGDDYLTQLLGNKDFVVIAAIDGDRVLGGVTAYLMHQYSGEYAEAYIYDIAVHKEYQRKGIGKMLMAALVDYCRKNNVKLLFVEAHEADGHAIEFYHRVGGKAEKIVHFNIEI